MRITKENTIGLVIDIQEKIFPVMSNKQQLIKNCTILIKGLQALELPMVVTQQYTKGLGQTVNEIQSLFADFSFIEKHDFSCCDEPTVVSKINSINAKNVIILGIEAHVCVLQTAVDLKAMGLNPIVVMDCTSSRSQEHFELAKERFRYENIMMTSYESILFELTRSSKSTSFKSISKLVK